MNCFYKLLVCLKILIFLFKYLNVWKFVNILYVLIFEFLNFLIFDNFDYGFFIFLFYFFTYFFSNFNWSPILFGVGLRWLGLKSTELILKILVFRSGLEWSCTRWSTTDSDQVHWVGMAVSMYSCLCFCGAILYFRISAQKSIWSQILSTVYFAPWDRFFDFSLPSYGLS